jgi:cell division transport system permease protein
MQLVGAKSSYIRRPFMIQAIAQGVISAIIGMALLVTLFFALNNWLESIEISFDLITFIILSATLLLLGAFITLISTWFALNKYLRMKLDDLY